MKVGDELGCSEAMSMEDDALVSEFTRLAYSGVDIISVLFKYLILRTGTIELSWCVDFAKIRHMTMATIVSVQVSDTCLLQCIAECDGELIVYDVGSLTMDIHYTEVLSCCEVSSHQFDSVLGGRIEDIQHEL